MDTIVTIALSIISLDFGYVLVNFFRPPSDKSMINKGLEMTLSSGDRTAFDRMPWTNTLSDGDLIG